MDKKIKAQIRACAEYKAWRESVVSNFDGEYEKGMQVHHFKPFEEILVENNINSVEDAIACKELWDISNGMVLKKGEHFILSQLERMRYNTNGFILLLKRWIKAKEIV